MRIIQAANAQTKFTETTPLIAICRNNATPNAEKRQNSRSINIMPLPAPGQQKSNNHATKSRKTSAIIAKTQNQCQHHYPNRQTTANFARNLKCKQVNGNRQKQRNRPLNYRLLKSKQATEMPPGSKPTVASTTNARHTARKCQKSGFNSKTGRPNLQKNHTKPWQAKLNPAVQPIPPT
ncbi:MAG: hypothetical protein HS123_23565 [Solibacteraceae bacterium]|nr:hypothetical protein [Solibacteraceae bacterium]